MVEEGLERQDLRVQRDLKGLKDPKVTPGRLVPRGRKVQMALQARRDHRETRDLLARLELQELLDLKAPRDLQDQLVFPLMWC